MIARPNPALQGEACGTCPLSSCFANCTHAKNSLNRILDGQVRRFQVTTLHEVERPQRKLSDPEGRFFAPVVQGALEQSENVY
jgi:hypothetical protein